MPQRALLLLNRKARQGKTDLTPALDALRQAGYELIREVEAPGHSLSDMIRAHKDRADLVIVGGGDGTLNSALEGLVETQLPLGILPLGTANDLARTLALPSDLAEACQVIAAGHLRRIDLGCVNGKHFFNVASVGLSVSITRQLTRKTKSRWGVLAYLVTAAGVLFRARPFRAEIRADGQTHHIKSVQIAVGNGRYYGGGMTISADAEIDDALLHLYSLEIDHWWQILPLLPAMHNGTLASSPRVRTLKGQDFEIRTLRKQRAVNADGELVSRTPCQVRLVPKALSVFAPPPAS